MSAVEALTKSEAQELATAVEQEAIRIRDSEQTLDHSYARLGILLDRFQKVEAWRALEYHSFAAYLVSLRDRFGRKQSQLYTYTEVANKLLPVAGEDGLNKMGVSKAIELVRAARRANREVTPELVAAAQDPDVSIKELKTRAFDAYNLKHDASVKGTWVDWGGAYLDVEEKKEVETFFELAERLLEQDKKLPDWVKRKGALLAAMREFVGAHLAEVYENSGEEDVK